MIPIINEFAINKIPFCEVVPKIFLNKLSFKILELIKVISSKILYKLLSIEENKFSKMEFIVLTITSVILIWELFKKSHPIRLSSLLLLKLNQLLK